MQPLEQLEVQAAWCNGSVRVAVSPFNGSILLDMHSLCPIFSLAGGILAAIVLSGPHEAPHLEYSKRWQ